MYMIAVAHHPLGMRKFATRNEAITIARTWGFGPWRVYLNLEHPRREASRVPSA